MKGLGVALVVVGVSHALPLLLLFFLASGQDGSLGGLILGAVFLSIFMGALVPLGPIALFSLWGGLALLRPRSGIRWAPHVACLLLLGLAWLGLGPTLAGAVSGGGSFAAFLTLVLLADLGVAVFGLVVLLRPAGRRYVALAAKQPPRRWFRSWPFAAAGGFVGTLLLGKIALHPLASLRPSANGAMLRADAVVALALAVAMLVGAGAVLSAASRRGSRGAAAAGWSAAGGVAFGVLIASTASALSRTPFLDGRPEDDARLATLAFAIVLAAVGVSGALAATRARAGSQLVAVGATLVGFGVATFVAASVVLARAETLEAAAAARTQRYTPGVDAALLVAGLALVALFCARRAR